MTSLAERIAEKAREEFGYTTFNGLCMIGVTEEKLAALIAAELAALKESEKKAIRLCETIWHRQWSNPEDCLMDAIDLMKAINPDHPMAKVRTLREEIAAKKDSYIALRKENEKLREAIASCSPVDYDGKAFSAKIETLALELHDSGDHESGGMLDVLAVALQRLEAARGQEGGDDG